MNIYELFDSLERNKKADGTSVYYSLFDYDKLTLVFDINLENIVKKISKNCMILKKTWNTENLIFTEEKIFDNSIF